jgi:hypothetical protein
MTLEKINPGDGWRLLGPDEVVKDGDERWRKSEKRWVLIPMDVPYTAKAYPAVRRRIPAKPERLVLKEVAASICHRKKKPETWKVVASIDATFPGTGYLDAAEARQLADWLTRYAEWREAQDSNSNGK